MDEILKCYQEILDALRDESVCEGLYQKIQNVIIKISAKLGRKRGNENGNNL